MTPPPPTSPESDPTGRTSTKSASRPGRRGERLTAPGKARKPSSSTDVKNFVLDTNVLLHDADALFSFEEHNIVIPFAVLEELDTFKKGTDDIARSARACIRHLDHLRTKGSLVDGVPLEQAERDSPYARSATGLLRIAVSDEQRPHAIHKDTPDNRILAVAYAMQQRGLRTVFVTKDINARIKAHSLGIDAEDYEHQKIDADSLYKGYVEATVTGALIDELYDERMLAMDRLDPALTHTSDEGQTYTRHLNPNEFALLKAAEDDSQSGVGRRVADTDHIVPVSAPRKPIFGLMARNVQQTMALDLLLDDEIKLVTLTGGAGTGKTLLALAAGMHKVYQEERYDRLLCARPIMPMGRDIGYLPGAKEEKLSAWMQPIFDNLEYLLSTRGSHLQTAESRSAEQRIEKLLADGRLVLEPLTYIRGRSIPHQFMIVDEAQNLTPHEVKTIVSRAGEGAKLVLTGDVEQIDNPYLDASSNGLSVAIEKMREQGIAGHVTLQKSERSTLASLAAEKL